MTEQTRNQLLETGRRTFAEEGLEGARVDRIAREAGVNKALINYHFRGKDGLYRAVLSEIFQGAAGQFEQLLPPELEPAARLRSWPSALWSVLERNPVYARLFLRELLSGCRSLSGEGMRGAGQGFALLARTLSVGRGRGEIERVEPFPLGLVLLGALLLAQVSAPLRQGLEGHLAPDELAGSRGAVVPLLQKMIEGALLGEAPRNP